MDAIADVRIHPRRKQLLTSIPFCVYIDIVAQGQVGIRKDHLKTFDTDRSGLKPVKKHDESYSTR
jgi:hypothetical protein